MGQGQSQDSIFKPMQSLVTLERLGLQRLINVWHDMHECWRCLPKLSSPIQTNSLAYRRPEAFIVLQLSNSSLLDEATAAAEAMTMCSALARGKKDKFLVSVS